MLTAPFNKIHISKKGTTCVPSPTKRVNNQAVECEGDIGAEVMRKRDKDTERFPGCLARTEGDLQDKIEGENMKLKPLSLIAAGLDSQGQYLYRVRFEHEKKGEVEYTFAVDTTLIPVVQWESEFWFNTFEDPAPADALLASILKFHEARNK